MANKTEPTSTAHISISESGIATFTRTAHNGRRKRVLEEHTAHARSLFAPRRPAPILPTRCITFDSEDACDVFVIEEPPSIRHITWRLSLDHRKIPQDAERLAAAYGESTEAFTHRCATQEEFLLAFPFVILVIEIANGILGDILVAYRVAPTAGRTDMLAVANLPNCYGNGSLCVPLELTDAHVDTTVARFINGVVDTFWASPWTSDLDDHTQQYAAMYPDLSSPWAWEIASRDPEFPFAMPWLPRRTLGDTMDELLGRTENEDCFRTYATRIILAEGNAHAIPPECPGVVWSPVERVRLSDGPLAIGDALFIPVHLRTGDRDVPIRLVTCLSAPSPTGNRVVALTGTDTPLPLVHGNALAPGVEVVLAHQETIHRADAAGKTITLGDRTTSPDGHIGTILAISAPTAHGGRFIEIASDNGGPTRWVPWPHNATAA